MKATHSMEQSFRNRLIVRATLLIAGAMVVALGVRTAAGNEPVPQSKAATWTEVTTPHFSIMSDDGEKAALRVADQFERIRLLYSHSLNNKLRVDPGSPILVIAVKNEKLLSEIIPEYWARKGDVHPAGLFVPGPEKNYIALRTDVSGEVHYLPVYHEYVHLIVELNFQHFPLWLDEGVADFFGNAKLVPGGGIFGQLNSSYLNLLTNAKLLPLDTLFRVDHRSPHYNEASKAKIFYAESWALVHYMMTDPVKSQANLIGKYINALEHGGDPVESARTLFGDLADLQDKLRTYVSRTEYKQYFVAVSDSAIATNYKVRTLSSADAEGRLGDFDLFRGQLGLARPKIEEAMRLDSTLPGPLESMGLLLLREQKPIEAQAYFSRAVALNSNSALANFFQGTLLLDSGDDEKTTSEAQQLLEKAVTLNPLLGPAWESLGKLYSRDPGTLDKALIAARNAVEAMPGEQDYQLDVAGILMAMKRFDEARAIASSVENLADPLVSSRAGQLLYQLDQANHVASSRDQYHGQGIDPFARSGGFSYGTDLPDPSSSSPVLERRGLGTIEAVDCSKAPAVTITFREGNSTTHLHFESFSTIDIQVESIKLSEKNLTCGDLNEKKAALLYQPVSGKAWDGEVVFIDLIDAR